MCCHPLKHVSRSGSVYVAVTGTAILVSLIGFTALHLSHLELRQTTSLNEHTYTRQLAQSSTELALALLAEDPDWRSTFTHGTENSRTINGVSTSLRFRLLDLIDGNLANDSAQEAWIEGIGRYGDSEYRYRVAYAPGTGSEQVVSPDPPTRFDQPAGTEVPYDIPRDNGMAQHFNPTLPADATNYTITSIDVKMTPAGNDSGEFIFELSYSDPDGNPTLDLIEYSFHEERWLPASLGWYSIPLTLATNLTLGSGYTFEIRDLGSGKCGTIVFADKPGSTLLLTFDIGSFTPMNDRSLLYRVNDQYTITGSDGSAQIVQGSWQRAATP